MVGMSQAAEYEEAVSYALGVLLALRVSACNGISLAISTPNQTRFMIKAA